MSSEPNSRLAPLILMKTVCCGGLVLIATGALSGLGTWLFDGGLIWLALAGLALVAVSGIGSARGHRQPDHYPRTVDTVKHAESRAASACPGHGP